MDTKQLQTLLNKKRKQAHAYKKLRVYYPELARQAKRNIEAIEKQVKLIKTSQSL